ncbi:uncharacterized protein DNG_10416 [Cephalotrichum gorgonifer]|uniref:Extracellular membrane protein CFEM domain-containing protein n=1 Tax=Cephalotrichum gorgonifer TaxID=2041049 RepID=A0AAE8N7L4_9PEZI|nr:uncharacterized protein DNG_10416 [Cephalotrichum gorgonifer]
MFRIAFLLACLALRVMAQDIATITDQPAYQSQRPCAQGCFYLGAFKGPDNLARAIDCDVKYIANDCFCRGDLQWTATSYLSSCVNSACDRKTVDVESAVALYNDYCTSNGFTRDAQEARPTDASTGIQNSPTATVTLFVTVTATPSTAARTTSNSPTQTGGSQGSNKSGGGGGTSDGSNGGGSDTGEKKDDSGLDVGEIVGIVVGILGFFATVAGSWFAYKAVKNKGPNQQPAMAPAQPAYGHAPPPQPAPPGNPEEDPVKVWSMQPRVVLRPSQQSDYFHLPPRQAAFDLRNLYRKRVRCLYPYIHWAALIDADERLYMSKGGLEHFRLLRCHITLYRPPFVQLCQRSKEIPVPQDPSDARTNASRNPRKSLPRVFAEQCSISCVENAQALVEHLNATSQGDETGAPWFNAYYVYHAAMVLILAGLYLEALREIDKLSHQSRLLRYVYPPNLDR